MRRSLCIVLAVSAAIFLTACSFTGKDREAASQAVSAPAATEVKTAQESQNSGDQTPAVADVKTVQTGVDSDTSSGTTVTAAEGSPKLLQSASIDLDGDGKNEQVEVYQKIVKAQTPGEADELEGILKITGKNGIMETTFVKKPAGLTEAASSVQFKDLDGDGTKDIFLILPDNGASFSLNYFYICNYKTGKSYTYSSDSVLSDFAGSFSFSYKGGGILEMKNDRYNFSASFDITDKKNGPTADDEGNLAYENSWVDPTPVEISDQSRLALVDAADGTPEIKVPLPVFGLATADMIGEVDLYYRVGSDFVPALKHFEVIDFNEGSLVRIGGCNLS